MGYPFEGGWKIVSSLDRIELLYKCAINSKQTMRSVTCFLDPDKDVASWASFFGCEVSVDWQLSTDGYSSLGSRIMGRIDVPEADLDRNQIEEGQLIPLEGGGAVVCIESGIGPKVMSFDGSLQVLPVSRILGSKPRRVPIFFR